MPKLTRTSVQAEPLPEKGSRKVWDSELKGFGANITSKGGRTWVVRYRNADGRPRQMALGDVSAISADQARKLAAVAKTDAAAGGDPVQERRARREATKRGPEKVLSVGEFAERFFREHCAAQKSADELRRKLDVEIIPRIGHLAVAEVRPSHVHELHHEIGAARPIAANRVRALLSTLFEHAERLELRPLGSNPVRAVRKFPEKRRERFLSREEIARFAAGLEQAVGDRPSRAVAAQAIRLLFLTGCRRNEILERRWDDYDARRGVLHLTDSKTGPRDVVLSTPALELLDGLERTSEWIFPAWRGTGHVTDIRKVIDRACKLAKPKLTSFRPHDIRHTFASLGVRQGMNLPLVGGLLGHARTATTEGYAHLADDHLREAADVMGGAIAGALSEGSNPGAKVIAFPRKRE